MAVDPSTMEIVLGTYRFNHLQFQELLKYVWRGGYPRWKNEIRPAYVLEMKNNILLNGTGVFSDVEFGD